MFREQYYGEALMKNKSKVVVANTGDSSISIIDPYAWKEVHRIQLSANSGPYDVVKHGSGQKVMVSQSYADLLINVDILSGEVIESIAIGRHPCKIAYDNTRKLAFITNNDSDTMSIIDANKMKLMGQIGVGSMPQGIDFDPISRSLAIANVNSNDVMIIDSDNLTMRYIVKIDRNPLEVKYSTDGDKLYISCFIAQSCNAGSLIVVETKDYTIVSEISLKGMPGQLYISRTGDYLLVASLGKGGLEIIDVREMVSLRKIPTNGMTQGMAVDLEEKYVYVTNPDDNSMAVVDWKQGKKIATVEVGKEPNGIVFI